MCLGNRARYINWHIRRFSQHYSQIKIIQQIDLNGQEVQEPLKIVIYRVIQAALNNSAAHSKADTIYIRLKEIRQLYPSRGGRAVALITKSLESGDGMSGFGLKSMRERIEIIGGSFSLHSLSGTGTFISPSCYIAGPAMNQEAGKSLHEGI